MKGRNLENRPFWTPGVPLGGGGRGPPVNPGGRPEKLDQNRPRREQSNPPSGGNKVPGFLVGGTPRKSQARPGGPPEPEGPVVGGPLEIGVQGDRPGGTPGVPKGVVPPEEPVEVDPVGVHPENGVAPPNKGKKKREPTPGDRPPVGAGQALSSKPVVEKAKTVPHPPAGLVHPENPPPPKGEPQAADSVVVVEDLGPGELPRAGLVGERFKGEGAHGSGRGGPRVVPGKS